MLDGKLKEMNFETVTDKELMNINGGIWIDFSGIGQLSTSGNILSSTVFYPYPYTPYGTGGTPNDYNI